MDWTHTETWFTSTWYNRRQDERKSYKRKETATNAKWCNQQVLWTAKERGWRQKLVQEKGVINLPSKAENQRKITVVYHMRKGYVQHLCSDLPFVAIIISVLLSSSSSSLLLPLSSLYDIRAAFVTVHCSSGKVSTQSTSVLGQTVTVQKHGITFIHPKINDPLPSVFGTTSGIKPFHSRVKSSWPMNRYSPA